MLEDGGANALMAAMRQHQTNTALLTSCLRALFYMGDSPELVSRMVDDSDLAKNVVFVMRSADYDVEVLRRGARVLGQCMEQPACVDTVIQAGSVQVLLSAVDTHKVDRDLGFTCYAVLSMGGGDAVIAGVKELNSAQTALNILRNNAYDQAYVQVLVGNLMTWVKDPAVSKDVCSAGMPIFLALVEVYAADAHMLLLTLQLMQELSAEPANSDTILMVGGMAATSAVVSGVVEDDSAARIHCREVMLACVGIINNVALTGSVRRV